MTLINTNRGQRSTRCSVCNLPVRWCFCDEQKVIDTPLKIILLRHPKEKFRSSGTGFLPSLCLANFTIVEPADLDSIKESLQEPIALLFPADGFNDGRLPEFVPQRLDHVNTLIVPDGSWSEARRMVRRDTWLRELPRVSPRMESRWIVEPLRQDKWSRPCTTEALGHWLAEEGYPSAAHEIRLTLERFVRAHWNARGRHLNDSIANPTQADNEADNDAPDSED